METFGLTKRGNAPDPSTVDSVLETNGRDLMDVIKALADGVNEVISQNGAAIDDVVKRLTNSVNGHLKRNIGILKPVGNELINHVNTTLAANDAAIQVAASHPDIVDYVRSVPAASSYAFGLPTVPPDGVAMPAAPAGQAAGAAPSFPVAAESVRYGVLVNCAIHEIACVPGSPAGWAEPGWNPPPNWIVVAWLALPPSQVMAWLGQYGPALLARAIADRKCIPSG